MSDAASFSSAEIPSSPSSPPSRFGLFAEDGPGPSPESSVSSPSSAPRRFRSDLAGTSRSLSSSTSISDGSSRAHSEPVLFSSMLAYIALSSSTDISFSRFSRSISSA